MNRKIPEQGGRCGICHEEFSDYNDVVPDHKNPKGVGGAATKLKPKIHHQASIWMNP